MGESIIKNPLKKVSVAGTVNRTNLTITFPLGGLNVLHEVTILGNGNKIIEALIKSAYYSGGGQQIGVVGKNVPSGAQTDISDVTISGDNFIITMTNSNFYNANMIYIA